MRAPVIVSITFFTRTLAAFLSQTEPDSNNAKPIYIYRIIIAEIMSLKTVYKNDLDYIPSCIY